ncbi:MAG: GldG family protein [Armatimonadetes bacterium]|nr:GldG family protein [Armatimonadota bacterium]
MNLRTRNFMSTVVSVALALALYVLVLAVSHQNQHTFDLTQNARHTLSQQSADLVKGLERPVKLWVFLVESDKPGRQKAEDLLERYRQNNPGQFIYEIVDPVRRNSLATMFEINQPGQGVVEFLQEGDTTGGAEARRERFTSVDEDAVTNALLKLTRQKDLKAYFLTGHGEAELDSQEGQGLSGLKAAAVKEGYQTVPLNLNQDKKIPEGCDVLVIAGPRAMPVETEQQILEHYLSGTGRVFFMVTPETPAYWTDLLKKYGFEVPAEVVVDAQSEKPEIAVGQEYDTTHAITSNFQQYVAFLLTRPVDVGKAPEGAEVLSLVKTGPAAAPYPLAQVLSRQVIEFDPGKARPISIMAVGNYPKEAPEAEETPAAEEGKEKKATPSARIAVTGNVAFATNQMLAFLGNRDLALNTLNWLAESEDMITIRPREANSQPMMVSAPQMRWVGLVHILFIPLVVTLVGILTAMRRR